MTSSVIRDSFRLTNLKKFIQSIATGDNLYVGIGRPQYWDTIHNTDGGVTISNSAPQPYSAKNTLVSENYDREDLMSLKKINSDSGSPLTGDIRNGILKNTWTAGKFYDTYRHDWDGTIQAKYDSSYPASLASVNYVVINSSADIYICLKQGRVSGPGSPVSASIYSPETGIDIGTNTGVKKTADGYYWKYVAATSGSDIYTFSSITNHPVQTLTSDPGVYNAYSKQWVSQVNSAAYKGGIYTINVTNSGSGYNGGNAGVVSVTNPATDANFKVVGNGTGLTLSVTYGANGSIIDVEVQNPGTGYSFVAISPTGGTGASFDVIYSPMTGLGCDPVKDTSALYLLITTRLDDTEGGKFTINNEYRKILLLSNMNQYGSTALATVSQASAYLTFNIGTTNGVISPDDIITGTQSGAKARVIDVINGVLRCIRTSSENKSTVVGASAPFLVGEQITTGSATANITLNTPYPDVDPYSGEVIYSEYRSNPIARTSGGTEIIKIIVEF